MKQILVTLLCVGFFGTPLLVEAQEKGGADKAAFWGNTEAYLLEQAVPMFELVDRALTDNPPVKGVSTPRRLALYLLDAMVHETRYDNSEPFNTFILSRVNKVIDDLSEPVDEGLKIYKIYNDGFVARTKSVTIALDVVRGSCRGEVLIPDSLIRQIVDHCDILFISHNHGDHADPVVAEMFTQSGKTVIAPTDVWPDNKMIQHVRSEKVIDKKIAFGRNKKLQVKIFPGHQDMLNNNIYVITTEEKRTIAHTGDQYNREDMEWIVNIDNHIPQPDVLTVNCWTHRMGDLVEGFSPKIVITGHENEMGHTVDHREAFWLTFQKMKSIPRDYVVMGWGEWFQCP
jgi:L-ascorbate metabolism protein UlaG (beta-lactamase superfamily)